MVLENNFLLAVPWRSEELDHSAHARCARTHVISDSSFRLLEIYGLRTFVAILEGLTDECTAHCLLNEAFLSEQAIGATS